MAEVPVLARAAEPGDRTGDRHHRQDLPTRAHARVARGPRRVAEHLRLEAEPRSRIESPEQERDEDRDARAEGKHDSAAHMNRRAGPERRIGQRLRGREDRRVEPLRLPPVGLGVEDEVRHQIRGDVIQHQRGDDLVRLEERAQDSRDQRPRRSARAAGDHHPCDHERRRPAVATEKEPGSSGGDGTDVELTLAADVEQTHPKGRRGGEAGEGERRGRDQRLSECAGVQERRIDDQPVARERIVPGCEQNDARGEEREDEGEGRHGDQQPARLAEPALNPHADHALPPSAVRAPPRSPRRVSSLRRSHPRT